MAEGGATQSPETVVHAVREHTKHCSVQNSCIRHTLFLLHGLTMYIVHVYMCIHVQCIHVQCIHVQCIHVQCICTGIQLHMYIYTHIVHTWKYRHACTCTVHVAH